MVNSLTSADSIDLGSQSDLIDAPGPMSIKAVLAAPNGVPLTGAWVTAADRETVPERTTAEAAQVPPTLCISVGGTAVLDAMPLRARR